MLELLELTPKTSDELKALLANKGWDANQLAVRWGMTKRRVAQILSDTDRPLYYDDAFVGLPKRVGQVEQLQLLDIEALKKVMEDRGWSSVLIAQRWRKTRRRIEQILKDTSRPLYLDDAFRGLPAYQK